MNFTMQSSDLSYKGKTCENCAYLTEKAPIYYKEHITEKEAGLCRLYILKDHFAIMLKNEIACPEFISKE